MNTYTTYTNANVKQEHVTIFNSNVLHELELEEYGLAEYFTKKVSGTGKRIVEAKFDGSDLKFAKKTKQFEDTPLGYLNSVRRQLVREVFHGGTRLDDQDVLESLINPNSMLVKYFKENYAKQRDLKAIEALLGSTTSVVDADENVGAKIALPATQILDDQAPKDFSVKTLQRLKHLMSKNKINGARETFVLLHDENVLQQLLSDTAITNHDTNTVRALVAGEVNSFMGITFKEVHSEVLSPAGADGTKGKGLNAILIAPKDMGAEWDGLDYSMKPVADPKKAGTTNILCQGSYGFGRLEDKRVINIKHTLYKG